jgi:hypothetical protein
MVQFMIMEPCAGAPGRRWPLLGRDGAALVRVGAARSAGIMVGRVIAEDRAGGHPPGVPGSWSGG